MKKLQRRDYKKKISKCKKMEKIIEIHYYIYINLFKCATLYPPPTDKQKREGQRRKETRGGKAKGSTTWEPQEVLWQVTPRLCRVSHGIKSNSFWCTLDISSSRSTSRLSSVSYRLSCHYRQYMCLISLLPPFLYLLIVWFFALSVLSENLLFFYCCESGWYLICWKICLWLLSKNLY